MASRSPITYTPRELQMASTRWINNILNLDHEWKVLNTIGTIQSPHWQNNAVVGNLYINKLLSAGKDTITLIDAGLVN
jgi:hypothetical protein